MTLDHVKIKYDKKAWLESIKVYVYMHNYSLLDITLFPSLEMQT